VNAPAAEPAGPLTTDPARALAAVAAAEERLLRSVRRMRPEQVGEPSALPGWTRGHLLTHIARNADALGNLLTGARSGTPTPMYPSPEARDRDIEAGAGRPLDEQLLDLSDAGQRLAELAAAVPADAWAVEVPHRQGPFPAGRVPAKRLGEVEYHHVDLALGYIPEQWPAEFVALELGPLTARQLASGALAPELLERIGRASDHARLAWLSGRSDGSDLGVPTADLPGLPALG